VLYSNPLLLHPERGRFLSTLHIYNCIFPLGILTPGTLLIPKKNLICRR
jgi:hypothetical protein